MREGGMERMRSLIGATDAQAEELRQWAGGNGALWHQIRRTLLFRAAVLREFDKLVNPQRQ